jgi:hypothetical protein
MSSGFESNREKDLCVQESAAQNEERCTRFYTHLEPEGKERFCAMGEKRFHNKVLKIFMFNNGMANWIKLFTLSINDRNYIQNRLSQREIHGYVYQRVIKHTHNGKKVEEQLCSKVLACLPMLSCILKCRLSRAPSLFTIEKLGTEPLLCCRKRVHEPWLRTLKMHLMLRSKSCGSPSLSTERP